MAAHSNILVWLIPWTEEPGGLWSYGLWGSKEFEMTKHSTETVKNYTFNK